MFLDDFTVRACYADTDAAGVIHHARYLEFFERSRTEWLIRLDAGPIELAAQAGLLLIIRETTLTFHQPGRLNDRLAFTHEITHKGRSQLTLLQKAWRVSETGEANDNPANLLVSAVFYLVCVDTQTMKSTALPGVFDRFSTQPVGVASESGKNRTS